MQTLPKPWQNLSHDLWGVRHHNSKSSNGQDKGTVFHASDICKTYVLLEKTKAHQAVHLKQQLWSTSSFTCVCTLRPDLLWRSSEEWRAVELDNSQKSRCYPTLWVEQVAPHTLKSILILPLMKPSFLLLRTLPALKCSGWNFPCQLFASGCLFFFKVSTEKGQ